MDEVTSPSGKNLVTWTTKFVCDHVVINRVNQHPKSNAQPAFLHVPSDLSLVKKALECDDI
ncbi:MAG: hypothetical protein AAFP90_08440, partial [Planctomycetota bacterium]